VIIRLIELYLNRNYNYKISVYIITIMVIFLDSNKMMAMVRAMKEEKELCVQDIKTFETLREEIKARKPKSWFMTN
jgi:hypothetical protein